jgi:hypothetical protein
MRFMYIVTSSHPPGPPTPALMEAMGKLADREIKAGRMIDNGGLMPVAMGAQVRITDGQLRVGTCEVRSFAMPAHEGGCQVDALAHA